MPGTSGFNRSADALRLARAPLRASLVMLLVSTAMVQDRSSAASASPPVNGAPANTDLNALVAAVTGWAAADMGLPVPVELPRLVFVEPTAMLAELNAQRRGQEDGFDASASPVEALAFYNSRTRTLSLPAGWTGGSPAELSILVHELVHHLQTLFHQGFACPADREKQAYATQERWLGMFGEDLESAFGIDRLTLLVTTSCMF